MSNLRTYIVRRLDGVDQDYTVDKKCNGSDLLDKVSRVKERAEREREPAQSCSCCHLTSGDGGKKGNRRPKNCMQLSCLSRSLLYISKSSTVHCLAPIPIFTVVIRGL